jgi:uncharacterized membrane protein
LHLRAHVAAKVALVFLSTFAIYWGSVRAVTHLELPRVTAQTQKLTEQTQGEPVAVALAPVLVASASGKVSVAFQAVFTGLFNAGSWLFGLGAGLLVAFWRQRVR